MAPVSGKLVFWQNIPSILQAPLIREVARQWDGQVVAVTENDVSPTRLALGWVRPDYEPAELVVEPSVAERAELLRNKSGDDVHFFSGFHAYPETYRAFKYLIRSAATVGVISERARDDNGLKSLLRRLRYRLHAARWGQQLNVLLAAGELGERWFRARGFRAETVVPFGYFVENTGSSGSAERIGRRAAGADGLPVRLLFVGQLVHRKGVDLLLSALAALDGLDWRLDVVGEGVDGAPLRVMSRRLGLDDRVHWHGVRPNSEIRHHMAQADVLVLPTRYDGWGAVVNEALTVGTRVVVSDACGASDLVRDPSRGAVAKAGRASWLAEVLQDVVREGPLPASARAEIRAWASESIAPAVAARYLIEVIRYARNERDQPSVPWRPR
jgi:glycosyltransferase involved in cell wall biosynthesis